MPFLWNKTQPAAVCLAATALLAALSLSSCSSSHHIEGIPSKLPDISLAGTVVTPPHRMQRSEYPFEPGGRYNTEWAAEGERRAGRSASATTSDVATWSGSYGDSGPSKRSKVKVTSRPPAKPAPKTPTRTPAPAPAPTPVVASTSPPKPSPSTTTTTTTTTPKPVATAKPKPKTPAKSGKSYTVKKGDTLSAIAARNGTTVAKLKSANGMSSDFLSIGKVLRIP